MDTEPPGSQPKFVLQRETAGEHDPDATGIAHDHCADLEQSHSNRPSLGCGEACANQRHLSDVRDQSVCERRGQNPRLIGPLLCGARTISKQSKLLLLHSVFHVAACTVALGVDVPRARGHVRDNEARVGSAAAVFGLHHDSPFVVPTLGRTPHRAFRPSREFLWKRKRICVGDALAYERHRLIAANRIPEPHAP